MSIPFYFNEDFSSRTKHDDSNQVFTFDEIEKDANPEKGIEALLKARTEISSNKMFFKGPFQKIIQQEIHEAKMLSL